MARTVFMIQVTGVLILCGCQGSDVTSSIEPTNEDAIYNIIRYDRELEFNLDLHDFSVPDTNLPEGLLSPPYEPVHFWRQIQGDSLFIGISLHDPVDSVGAVPWASVYVEKFFYGTLEIIARDTSGGGDEPVRISKDFGMVGIIYAIFEKVGFDYNTRRGWILSQISDAIFSETQNSRMELSPTNITLIQIQPPSGPIITVNPQTKLIRDVPEFEPGDSVTIFIHTSLPDDHVSIRYASGDTYLTRQLTPIDSTVFAAGFRFPGYIEFNHFLVDVISHEAISDTTQYEPNAIGVLYRIR
jgi:hypothetical protein